MESFHEIPYGKIKDFKPFFTNELLCNMSKKDSHRLIFLLCDTIKRLADDVKKLKA